MIVMVVFPSAFFDMNQVHEDLQQEYEAVKAVKLYETVLFGYDKWFNEGRLVLNNPPEEMRTAIYRGWMMKPEQYETFYELLLNKNIHLITSPEEYRLMHIFPNVYPYVREDTARIEVFPLHSQIDVEKLKQSFTRFMVKDYVKSVKGTEFPRYFDQTVTQKEFTNGWKCFRTFGTTGL